jgi:hypothetical protein
VTKIACFAGPAGSRLSCSSARRRGDQAWFEQEQLNPFEAFTVVVALPKGVVPEPKPILEERWSLRRAFTPEPWVVGPAAVLGLVAVGGVLMLIWKTGRDRRAAGFGADVAFPRPGTPEERVGLLEDRGSPVEFLPPDGLRPGQVGTLIDEVANPLDVTATIVDLAVRGYLRIEEIPKSGLFGRDDWKLVKLKDTSDLLQFERTLADGLFEDADDVLLSSLRNAFAERMRKVQDALYNDAVRRKWFVGRPDKIRARWAGLGFLAVVLSGTLLGVLIAYTKVAWLGVPPLAGSLVLWIGSGRMPRRTAKGTGLVGRVRGFKTFIEDSEAVRAKFAEDHGIFTEYLPYAVVFGATKKWAKAFEGLEDELPDTSSFYIGTRPFRAHDFCESVDGFTVGACGTLTSTPASSGGSGFGGGGVSAGGGGGGGGGSW